MILSHMAREKVRLEEPEENFLNLKLEITHKSEQSGHYEQKYREGRGQRYKISIQVIRVHTSDIDSIPIMDKLYIL